LLSRLDEVEARVDMLEAELEELEDLGEQIRRQLRRLADEIDALWRRINFH